MKRGVKDTRRARSGRSLPGVAKSALAVIAWFAIWQVASLALANPWLLSSPDETLGVWANLILTGRFWEAVTHSLMRVALGFVIAFAVGCALGYLAARLPGLRTFLKPAVLTVKSAPVVCIIALLLVAAGSNATTSIVVGLVVFPQFYHAVMDAALSRDTEIDEMLDVFGVPRARRPPPSRPVWPGSPASRPKSSDCRASRSARASTSPRSRSTARRSSPGRGRSSC